MVKITVHEDCGNAPKKLFLKNFIVAIVTNDSNYVTSNTTDNVRWDIIGSQSVSGKQEVLSELQQARSSDIKELVVNTIVTHGYNGATEGVLKFENGKVTAFCDIYLFNASTNNAPIKEMRTYAITLT